MVLNSTVLLIGLSAAFFMVFFLAWSIWKPEKRVWPPQNSIRLHRILVWVLTATIFSAAFLEGLMDWNRFEWPAFLRWGLGLPLIIVGNGIAWREAMKLGLKVTSGSVGSLRTGGFYRYSRNPQYMADIGILLGWLILSASLWALPVLGLGLLILILAPFAEEYWLKEVYGSPYAQYCHQVRRYL